MLSKSLPSNVTSTFDLNAAAESIIFSDAGESFIVTDQFKVAIAAQSGGSGAVGFGPIPSGSSDMAVLSAITEIGPNDFRISFAGGTGNPSLDADTPDVVYNAAAAEYLVVWSGEHFTDGQFDIMAQRIDATTGAAIGSVITVAGGPLSTNFDGDLPSVAWSSTDNEYLVMYRGDLTNGVEDLLGQRVSDTGASIGSAVNYTNHTTEDLDTFDIVWDSVNNQFVVVAEIDGDVAGKTENYIFQIGPDGQIAGVDGLRISNQAPGVAAFDTAANALAFDSATGQFFAVWRADSNADGLVDNESEIFGQLLLGDAPVPVNTAPTLTDFAPSVTFAENAVNAPPQLLDADVTLTDPEGNFDGGTVTLTGILAEDTVSVQNVGTGAGEIGFDGTNVSFGGVAIGALAGGATVRTL